MDKKFKKAYPKQVKALRIHVQVVPTDVPFVLLVPDQKNKVQIETKTKTTAIQMKTIDTITIKTIDTKIMAISKTTLITTIAIYQTSNQIETTQTNNHVDIVLEQIIRAGIVKPVLTAEDWDICLPNVEHHDKIGTIGKKIRMLIEARKIQSRPQRKFLTATKYFKLDQTTSQVQHVNDTNDSPLTQQLTSVVDHRNLYLQTSSLNKQVEAVGDSGTSLSCLSEKLFNQIKESHQVKIQPSTNRLSTANWMPIEIKGTVSVPRRRVPRKYEHTLYALI